MVAIGRKSDRISRLVGVAVWMATLSICASPVLAAVGEQTKVVPQQVSDKAQRLVLLVGVTTLLLAFLFVGVVLIRALRHVRQQAMRPTPAPTDASDVWAMHRLPDDASDSMDDGNGSSDGSN